MAILQISRIQIRRGLQENLPPALASAEFGWAMDSRRLFIGNGTLEEGAPTLGNTEILTTYSDLSKMSNMYTYDGNQRGAIGFSVTTGPSTISPVKRSLGEKLDDFANIRDFGGVGNGVANDTRAINHAIEQLYKKEDLFTKPQIRRTLYLPAGTYKLSGDVIRLLPYVKLVGDGINSTFIVQDDDTQDCIVTTTDSLGRSGAFLNNAIPGVIGPGFNEVSNLTLRSQSAKLHNMIIDAASDVTFTRVRFECVDYTIGTLQTLANMKSGVYIDSSMAAPVSRITFNACEFIGQTYGIYTDKMARDITVYNSSFSYLHRGVNLGEANVGGAQITSVKVTTSTFTNISQYGIYASFQGNQPGGATGVTHTVSAFNTFNNVGNMQGITPLYNVVYFGGKNSYSMGDTFDRSFDALVASINLNDQSSFATMPDGRYMLGKQFTVGGQDTLLHNNTPTAIPAGIIGVGDYPSILEYTVLRGVEQRTGSMLITPLGSSVVYSDDYTETGDLGVILTPVLNTGVVELLYVMTNLHSDAILKTSSRTLVGKLSPPGYAITAPGAPTITGVI